MLTALVLTLLAQTPAGPKGPIYSTPNGSTGAAAECPQGADGGVGYDLFAAGSTDQSTVTDLCTTYSANMTGAYWCLKGDGTGTGAAITGTGSPTTQTHSYCGNGDSCGDVTVQRLNGVDQYFATGAVASPTGSFTTCVVFNYENVSGSKYLVYKLNANGTGDAFRMYAAGAGTVTADIFKSGGNSQAAGPASTVTRLVKTVGCTRYTYSADGTSNLRVFVNGVGGTANTTAVGPMIVVSNAWVVGAELPATDHLKGSIGNAFFTESALDDATILAISNSALGVTTPTVGAAPTWSRSSVRRCSNAADTELTVVPANKACVMGGGLGVANGATNSLLQSSVQSNASWTKTNATCVNTALHPDGSSLATRCTATAANASICQTVTVASSLRATSAYLKRAVGTGVINMSRDNLSTRIAVNASINGSTYTRLTPATHSGLSTTSANPTICFEIITDTDAIDIALAQDEGGGSATPPIETTTAGSARTADAATWTNPLSTDSPPAWCLGATLAPDQPWGSIFVSGGGDRRMLLLNTSAGAANSGYLAFLTARTPNLLVYNSASALKQLAGTAVAADSTAHRLVGATTCGALSIKVDGVSAGTTLSGTGTGIVATQSATVNITDVAAGSRQVNGVMSNIKIAASTTGCD